jgi:hypothetical protein
LIPIPITSPAKTSQKAGEWNPENAIFAGAIENSIATTKNRRAVRYSGIMPVTQKVITITTNAATVLSEEESIMEGERIISVPIRIDIEDRIISILNFPEIIRPIFL